MIRRAGFVGTVVAFLSGWCNQARAGSEALSRAPGDPGTGMMQGGMMQGGMMQGGMMNMSQRDRQAYMQMFDHHKEIIRRVHQLRNGVRTVTESNNPLISALLREHVPAMYKHVAGGQEVRCMSESLPTLFQNASKYHRHLTFTRKGVAVTETSDDPVVIAALRRHAAEITGFVREGMPAGMRGMMQ